MDPELQAQLAGGRVPLDPGFAGPVPPAAWEQDFLATSVALS